MELELTNLSSLSDVIPSSIHNQKSVRLCAMVAVSFMSYCYGYRSLSRFMKAFVINESIPQVNQLRLTDAIWRLIFSVWIVLFFSVSLWDGKGISFIDVFIRAATIPQCNTTLYKLEGDASSEITFLIAPVSFFLHQLYISATSPIVEPAVVSMGCLALFVFSTNSCRCPHLCLQILFFLALNVGTLELARAIYALKSRCKGFKGPPASSVLQVIAAPAFFLHIFTWAAINFYMFPTLYMSLPSVRESSLPCPSATAYINIFLIFFAHGQFFGSPTWSLFKLLVQRPTERRATPKSLAAVVLLPYTSPLLPELRAIQMNFLLDAIPTSAERRMMRKKILSSGSQTSVPISEGKADFLSIVKCVKILKRKMRYRYEQKTAQDSATESGSEMEPSLNENDSDASSSGNQDVTDIYIPVPAFTNTVKNSEEEVLSTESLEVTADVHCPDEDQNTDAPEDEQNTSDDHQQQTEESENHEDINSD